MITYRLPFLDLFEAESVDADSDIAYDKLELDAEGGNYKIKKQEKEFSKKMDVMAHGMAKRFGAENVPWFKITVVVLWVYLILTLFVLFFRSDFVNVSSLSLI